MTERLMHRWWSDQIISSGSNAQKHWVDQSIERCYKTADDVSGKPHAVLYDNSEMRANMQITYRLPAVTIHILAVSITMHEQELLQHKRLLQNNRRTFCACAAHTITYDPSKSTTPVSNNGQTYAHPASDWRWFCRCATNVDQHTVETVCRSHIAAQTVKDQHHHSFSLGQNRMLATLGFPSSDPYAQSDTQAILLGV